MFHSYKYVHSAHFYDQKEELLQKESASSSNNDRLQVCHASG